MRVGDGSDPEVEIVTQVGQWRLRRGDLDSSEAALLKQGRMNVKGTHDEDPHGKIPTLEHPERPSTEPTMPASKDERQHSRPQDVLEDRSIVALDDPSERDGELVVLQLADAHVGRVFQTASQEEEGCGVLYSTKEDSTCRSDTLAVESHRSSK